MDAKSSFTLSVSDPPPSCLSLRIKDTHSASNFSLSERVDIVYAPSPKSLGRSTSDSTH